MSTFPSGTVIANRYEVVKSRAGAMGVVYLCLDRQVMGRLLPVNPP